MVAIKQRPKFVKVAVIMAVVIVLSLLGWFAWQARNKPATKAPEAAQIETKYLTITDWGVRFPLTAETHDTYYNSRGASPLLRNLNARFLNPETGCDNDAAVLIYRVQKDAVNIFAGNKKYAEIEQGKVIDDYFYFIKPGVQACPGNKDSQARLDKVRAELLQATPTIEKL